MYALIIALGVLAWLGLGRMLYYVAFWVDNVRFKNEPPTEKRIKEYKDMVLWPMLIMGPLSIPLIAFCYAKEYFKSLDKGPKKEKNTFFP